MAKNGEKRVISVGEAVVNKNRMLQQSSYQLEFNRMVGDVGTEMNAVVKLYGNVRELVGMAKQATKSGWSDEKLALWFKGETGGWFRDALTSLINEAFDHDKVIVNITGSSMIFHQKWAEIGANWTEAIRLLTVSYDSSAVLAVLQTYDLAIDGMINMKRTGVKPGSRPDTDGLRKVGQQAEDELIREGKDVSVDEIYRRAVLIVKSSSENDVMMLLERLERMEAESFDKLRKRKQNNRHSVQ